MTQGRRAWWLIDGLPHWLLTLAIENAPDRLGAFAAAMQENRVARLLPLVPNCQTPPSLAALYCGKRADQTGLCGFDLPDFGVAPLALQPAFDRGPGDWPRIWEHERDGRGLRLLHVPYVRAATKTHAKVCMNGFGPPTIAPVVLDPDDALESYGIAPQGGAWEVFNTTSAARCMATKVMIEDANKVIVLGAWPVDGGATPFMATGLQHSYRQGVLGRTLMQGGTGTAEKLFVGSLRQMSRYYNELWLEQFRAGPEDDIYGYQPALDLALHELIGYVAQDCGHWRPERSACVLPLLIDMLADFDVVIAQTRQESRPHDRVIVCSDHGMMPIDLLVRPNLALRQLGFLSTDHMGNIDITRSLMWLHPAESGLLCLRSDAPDAASMIQQFTALLTEETGRSAQVMAYPNLEKALAPPADLMARHFLWAGAGCQIRADLEGPLTQAAQKTGEHVATGPDPALHGVVIDLSVTPVLRDHTMQFETCQVSNLLTAERSATYSL